MIRWLSAAIVLVTVLSATAANAQVAPPPEPLWLVVIQGEVTETAPGRITLAVPSTALAFTDRPMREVRFVDLATLVAAAWGEGGLFRIDPPNAALVDETAGEIAILTIGNAVLSDGLLVLDVLILEGATAAIGDRVAITIDGAASVGIGMAGAGVF